MNKTNDDIKQESHQDTSDDSVIIDYTKNYQENIIKFFDNEDPYGEKLHNYFMGLCSMDKGWMTSDRSNKIIDENISLDKNDLKSFNDDNKPISKSELKIIFQSYHGKLRQDSYHIRVFLTSLYQLEELDMNYPSPIWQWVGKLCQLLNYYLYKNDKRRIQDISSTSRLRLNPDDVYHQSWQSCIELQENTLVQTYQSFSNYKEKVKNDNSQKYFINFFRNIEYVYRQKITNTHRVTTRKVVSRTAKPRMEIAKYSNIDEDNDELHVLTEFHRHDVDINSTRLDDPHPDYITLSPLSLRVQEKYSPRQQRLRTLSKYDHLNKNNRYLAPNQRLLPSFAIKAFHNYLIKKITTLSSEKINDKHIIAACRLLLLVLYTGRPSEMIYADLTDNKHRLFDIKQDVLNIELPITKLRIKQKDVDKVLNNQSTVMMLYLPKNSVKDLMMCSLTSIKFSDIKEAMSLVINKAKEKLNLPLLSLGRIQSACYILLVRQFGTEDLANIITARNAHKSASLYYLSQQTSSIQAGYDHMMAWLFDNEADDVMTKPVDYQAFCIGSQNSPTINIVRALMKVLCQEVQSSTNLIDKFNAHNLWLWHVCLLLTSMRAVEGVPGFLHQLNFKSSLIWVSDKEERIDVDSSRLVPMCDFLKKALQDFLVYLDWFGKMITLNNPELGQKLNAILNDQYPLLSYIDETQELHVLSPKFITRRIEGLFAFKVDWTRHFGKKLLTDYGIGEPIILSLFGHEAPGQESYRETSSLSIQDILSTKDCYECMARDLELTVPKVPQETK